MLLGRSRALDQAMIKSSGSSKCAHVMHSAEKMDDIRDGNTMLMVTRFESHTGLFGRWKSRRCEQE